MNRVTVIVNPRAGRRSPVAMCQLVDQTFRQAGLEPDFVLLDKREGARVVARKAAERGEPFVVAAGGDGTVLEVVNGLARSGTALGIIPTGTANLLALEMSIPLDIRRACGLLAGPSCRATIDLGVINGLYFSGIAGVGYSTEIMHNARQRLKGQLGMGAYLWSGIRTLARAQIHDFSVVADGQTYKEQALTVLVANIGRLGPGKLYFGRNISPRDGLLDLVIVRVKTFAGGLRALYREFIHRSNTPEDVLYLKVREVEIDSAGPLPFIADGETAGTTPFRARVVPGAIQVIVPVAH